MDQSTFPTAFVPGSPVAPTSGLADFARKTWYVLAKMPEIRGRLRRIDRLSAMSDAELAWRGQRREDIIADVFLRGEFF